ncbi:hypothetical protein AtNW77_Chr2g0261301 [Arabidopsis thaliana]|uniref:Uncharacterized protein n=1 Tax=Arabidopsis thaliana TaxID=3702 RepID=A0A178VYX6_ARATH|nr:hypothetical protein AXX17_AT2G36600 [Arabidopsis thaliana]
MIISWMIQWICYQACVSHGSSSLFFGFTRINTAVYELKRHGFVIFLSKRMMILKLFT